MADAGVLFGYARYRDADARLGASIEDATLRALGVVEDDEPTAYSHYAYMAQFEHDAAGDFTPAERMAVRAQLGLGPYAPGGTAATVSAPSQEA